MADDKKSCMNCGNRCMDMDLDPYCAASGIVVKNPFGLTLKRGPIEECKINGELTLWEKDLRSQR